MPFKSRAQQRACYAKQRRGENGSWDCDEYSKHTNFENLPERKGECGYKTRRGKPCRRKTRGGHCYAHRDK